MKPLIPNSYSWIHRPRYCLTQSQGFYVRERADVAGTGEVLQKLHRPLDRVVSRFVERFFNIEVEV